MSSEEVSNIISKIREILQTALDNLNKIEQNYRGLPIEVKLDIAKIEALPFVPYKSGIGSWLLWEKNSDARPLRDAVEKAPGRTLDIGGFHYKIGGDRGQFLSRFPISKK